MSGASTNFPLFSPPYFVKGLNIHTAFKILYNQSYSCKLPFQGIPGIIIIMLTKIILRLVGLQAIFISLSKYFSSYNFSTISLTSIYLFSLKYFSIISENLLLLWLFNSSLSNLLFNSFTFPSNEFMLSINTFS